MPVGITRAQDRVAFWVEAAEEPLDPPISEPSTSEPPKGVGAGSLGYPNSNKFKTPANQLKKHLETTVHPSQVKGLGYHPEATKGIEDWAAKYPDFTKNYLKPQHNESLKNFLGQENHEKFLHHAPTPYSDALTKLQQAPAPKSNKFTTPANGLKKLLNDPHTLTQHVGDWLDSPVGSTWAKTYMQPQYDDALKSHLGDKDYNELKKHISDLGSGKQETTQDKAEEQNPHEDEISKIQELLQPAHSPQQPEKTLGQKGKDLHKGFNDYAFDNNLDFEQQKKNLLDWHSAYPDHGFDKLHDEHFGNPDDQDELEQIKLHQEQMAPQGLGDKLKAVYPEMNDKMQGNWNGGAPETTKKMLQSLIDTKVWGKNTVPGLQKIMDEHFGGGEQQSPDDAHAAHQQNLINLEKVMGSDPGGQGYYTNTKDYEDWENSLNPNVVKSFLKYPEAAKANFEQHLQDYYHDSGSHDDDWAEEDSDDDDGYVPGDDDEWEQQYLPQQGIGDKLEHVLGHPMNGTIKQMWNGGELGVDNFSSLKANNPDVADELQQVWNEHHGLQGGETADEEQQVDQSPKPGLAEGVKKIFPNGDFPLDPQKQKAQLESWLKYLPETPGYEPYIPKLKQLYDQHFGGGSPEDLEPADLGYGDEAYTDGGQSYNGTELFNDLDKAKPGFFHKPFFENVATPENAKNTVKNFAKEHPELQSVYDKHFGDGGQQVTQDGPDLTDEMDGQLSYIKDSFAGMSHADQMAALKSMLDKPGFFGNANKPAAQALYDKYSGGGEQPPANTGYDHSSVLSDLKKIWPGAGSFGDNLNTDQGPEVTKQALEKLMSDWESSPDKANAIQAIIDKNFGGVSQPVQQQIPDNPESLSENHKDLLQFAKDNDVWSYNHLKTLQSPEFKKWFDAQPQHYQSYAAMSPSKTMQDFAESQDELDQIKMHQEQEPAEQNSQQTPAFNSKTLAQDVGAISGISPDKVQGKGIPFKDMTPEQAKESLEELHDLHPEKGYGDLLEKHFGPAQLTSESAMKDWKKIFPGYAGYPFNSVDHALQHAKESLANASVYGAEKKQLIKDFINKYEGGQQATQLPVWPVDVINSKIPWFFTTQYHGTGKLSENTLVPGASAFFAEYGVTPDKPKVISDKNLINVWKGLTDSQKQKYIDAESGVPAKADFDPHQLAKEFAGIVGMNPDKIKNAGKLWKTMTSEEAEKALKGHLDWPDHGDDIKALYNKYFGSGQQQKPAFNGHALATDIADVLGYNPEEMTHDGETKWKDLPEDQAAESLQELIDTYDNKDVIDKLQKVYDQHFGNGAAQAPAFDKSKTPSVQELMAMGVDAGIAKNIAKQTPENFWKNVDHIKGKIDGGSTDSHYKPGKAWFNINQWAHSVGVHGPVQAQPIDKTKTPAAEYLIGLGVPAHNAEAIATQSPEQFWSNVKLVKKKIAEGVEAASGGGGFSGIYSDPNHLWNKIVTGLEGGQPAKPAGQPWGPDVVKKLLPNLGSDSVNTLTGWATSDPEHLKQKMQQWSDPKYNHGQAIQDGAKKILDTYFPNGQFVGQGASVDDNYSPEGIYDEMQDLEPQEPAKPFKSEELNPEDINNWSANKPQTPADWKKFSTWWGNTKIPPESEAGLYNEWFGKDATPEQAQQWFQSVFEHNSNPSEGDLGLDQAPGWAQNSWAFGKNADQEWPVFKEWATKHPGIPKGTSIKQKVQIWNGLTDDQKAHVAQDYLPQNPVDTKAVLTDLQAAYPESNWGKWQGMTQGQLSANVKNLANKGFAPAIAAYNKYFGGDMPMPEEVPEGEEDTSPKMPVDQVPPSIPQIDKSELPPWAKPSYKFGQGKSGARAFSNYLNWAQSVGGSVEDASQSYNNFYNTWENLPQGIKNQLEHMPAGQTPWKEMDGFEEWMGQQPTPKQQLQAIDPEKFGDGNLGWGWNKTNYGSHQYKDIKNKIDQEQDPEKKNALIGLYHQYFPTQNQGTLAETLKKFDPDPGIKKFPGWDQYLKGASPEDVGKLIKKKLKTETDPEKWIQYVDAYNKYFSSETPSGHSIINKAQSKNVTGAGVASNASSLKQLHYWKTQMGGDPKAGLPYSSSTQNYEHNSPFLTEKLQNPDGGSFPAYKGWTPPEGVNSSTFKADPAMMGDTTHATYSAPPEQQATGHYKTMLDVAQNSSGYSNKDKAALKSEGFRNWFSKAPKGYQQTYDTHPGIALDDFSAFMNGGAPYGDTPAPAPGKNKYFDVSPFANLPKKDKNKDIPVGLTHNKPRWDQVKFPQHEDAQETIPLGPGEKFAPGYAPMPIWRIQPLYLDREPNKDGSGELHFPDWVKPEDKHMHLQKQKARLRRIDEILNGKPTARDPNKDMADFDTFASKHGLDEKSKLELASQLFTSKQPDLFTDDKWAHFEDFAKKHNINPSEMHDLAKKMEVTPPPKGDTKGNYEHPELANLILDYFENWDGGLGTHWTRDIDKAYNGIPAASLGKEQMTGTDRQVPVVMSGLWGGQGEHSTGSGGAYDANDSRELEHNLQQGAPVHVHRLQIRSPHPQGKQGEGDWHDLIDHGPISQWSPGRDETASGHSVNDKPSLAKSLGKILPDTFDAKHWDTLKPGHQTDAEFSKLIGKYPQDKDKILKEYQRFFVGRPDLPTKPHRRHARIFHEPRRLVAGLDETNPSHLFDLARGWGVKNPELYGLPMRAKEFVQDLGGALWTVKEHAKEHGFGIQNPRRGSLTDFEAAIERLATAPAIPQNLQNPHWLNEYQHYQDPEDNYQDWLKTLDPDELEEWGKAEYPDDAQSSFENYLSSVGADQQDDDDYYDEDDYHDDDENNDEYEYAEGDFGDDPPEPDGDRPQGWPNPPPLLKNDDRGRQYFPPHGVNPPSTSPARPYVDIPDDPMPHQPYLPGQDWPNDKSFVDMYRGVPLDLRHPDLAHVRRALWGGRYEDQMEKKPGDQSGNNERNNGQWTKAHPEGFDNKNLGEHILNHLENNPKSYEGKTGYGLGPHWSLDHSTAHQFANQGTGNGSNPLKIPAIVRAQWKGAGEDPYRTNTQGNFGSEHEVTILPGAKMHVDSVQIQHPHTKQWHEVLPEPSQRHASVQHRMEYGPSPYGPGGRVMAYDDANPGRGMFGPEQPGLVGFLGHDGDGQVTALNVHQDYRHQGIANAMVDLARQNFPGLSGSEYTTPAGQAFQDQYQSHHASIEEMEIRILEAAAPPGYEVHLHNANGYGSGIAIKEYEIRLMELM
jgi:hypothetical protein